MNRLRLASATILTAAGITAAGFASVPALAAPAALPSECTVSNAIDVTCLRLGPARVLHLPGELFVEYQLAAQAMKPDSFIAMAAYGDYAPGYIGTEAAYPQGGYETSPSSSLVAPSVERVLTDAMQRLLHD